MKLQTLKSRLPTMGTRLAQVGRLEVDRMRGRAAVSRRARWLEQHPLCCRCEDEGKTAAGTQVDHTVPLWAGGVDDYETNGATLCDPHHDAKTACEARMRAAGGWMAAPCTCGQHEGGSPTA